MGSGDVGFLCDSFLPPRVFAGFTLMCSDLRCGSTLAPCLALSLSGLLSPSLWRWGFGKRHRRLWFSSVELSEL